MSAEENTGTEAKINFAKLAPFDSSVSDHSSMYDNLPYQRNQDMCNETKVAKRSGNVLKFYTCEVKDAFRIDNKDAQTLKMLSRLKRENTRPSVKEVPPGQDIPPQGGITEEQMDELFRDSDDEEAENPDS